MLFIKKVSNLIDKKGLGLHRDDGLSNYDNLSGAEIEWKKKHIVRLSKDCGLSIIVTTNITTMNFQDVAFDLKKRWYKPFRKSSDIYIKPNIH